MIKKTSRRSPARSLAQRTLGAVDLAIDFATLGEYGLEPLPTDGPCRERRGHETAWEAFARARRRGCVAVAERPAALGGPARPGSATAAGCAS